MVSLRIVTRIVLWLLLLLSALSFGQRSSKTFAPWSYDTTRHPVHYDSPYSIEPSVTKLRAFVIMEQQDSSGAHHVFSFDWKTNEMKEVFTLQLPKGVLIRNLQVAPNGNAVYAVVDSSKEESIVVWDEKKSRSFAAGKHREAIGYSSGRNNPVDYDSVNILPDFLISPDGAEVVFYENCWVDIVDSSLGVSLDEFSVARLPVGDSTYRMIRIDTIAICCYMADETFSREVKRWSSPRRNSIYINDYYTGTLHNDYHTLWKLNLTTARYELVDSTIEQFYSVSPDNRLVLYTNNDETCCTGINYTNNKLILFDTELKKRVILYDEYERYHNKDKGEDHTPINAECSPDSKWIGATIGNLIDKNAKSGDPYDRQPGVADSLFASHGVIIVRIDRKEEKQFDDRDFIGWLDDQSILVRQYNTVWQPKNEQNQYAGWKETQGSLRVIDISTGKEKELSQGSMRLLRIVWL